MGINKASQFETGTTASAQAKSLEGSLATCGLLDTDFYLASPNIKCCAKAHSSFWSPETPTTLTE